MLYSTVHGFDWWTMQQSSQMGLLGVVKWWGLGVYLLGTSVWQGQLQTEGSDQTWHSLH